MDAIGQLVTEKKRFHNQRQENNFFPLQVSIIRNEVPRWEIQATLDSPGHRKRNFR